MDARAAASRLVCFLHAETPGRLERGARAYARPATRRRLARAPVVSRRTAFPAVSLHARASAWRRARSSRERRLRRRASTGRRHLHGDEDARVGQQTRRPGDHHAVIDIAPNAHLDGRGDVDAGGGSDGAWQPRRRAARARCRNACRWHRLSEAFCMTERVRRHPQRRDRRYLSTLAVIVPPPKNKNPIADAIAACAPKERPETPPDPPVAAAAAAAAPPADAVVVVAAESTRARSLRSTRNVSTSWPRARHHARQRGRRDAHARLQRRTLHQLAARLAGGGGAQRQEAREHRPAKRARAAEASAVPARARRPEAAHAPASARTCACRAPRGRSRRPRGRRRSTCRASGAARRRRGRSGDARRRRRRRSLWFATSGGAAAGAARASTPCVGSMSCHKMSALATTRVSTKSGRTWSSRVPRGGRSSDAAAAAARRFAGTSTRERQRRARSTSRPRSPPSPASCVPVGGGGLRRTPRARGVVLVPPVAVERVRFQTVEPIAAAVNPSSSSSKRVAVGGTDHPSARAASTSDEVNIRSSSSRPRRNVGEPTRRRRRARRARPRARDAPRPRRAPGTVPRRRIRRRGSPCSLSTTRTSAPCRRHPRLGTAR